MEQVYCVKCKFFRLCDERKPYCIYENECDINDCEDSESIKIRKYYIEKGVRNENR